ncbi:MAG: glycerophosphodiester phosphodiesterase family protein, partial [Nanoarchaeota archaeon]
MNKKLKGFAVALWFVLIAYILHVLFAIPETPDLFSFNERILGAHRGNALNYTENTIPAFQNALEENKYKFIEFDVQYTKDKQAIVHHDTSLIRLQSKLEFIEDLNYTELLNISDYHIPTYEEVMNLLAGKKPLNIEIKSQGNSEHDKELAEYIITDCKERNILNTTMISSISSDVLLYLRNNHPDIKTGKIYYVYTGSFLDTKGFVSDIFTELDRIDAEYLMIYGANLKNFGHVWQHMRTRQRTDQRKIFLAYWYFNDEMYLVYRADKEYYYEDPATKQMVKNESMKVPPEVIGA